MTDQPDYPLLLRRMQFLDLVQRVARMDVDACAQTVGLDALSFHSRMFHSETTSAALFKTRKQEMNATRALPGGMRRHQAGRQPFASNEVSRPQAHQHQRTFGRGPRAVADNQMTSESDENEVPARRRSTGEAARSSGLVQSSPEKARAPPSPRDRRRDDPPQSHPGAFRASGATVSNGNPVQSPSEAPTRIPLEVLRMVGGIVKEMRQQQEPSRPATRDSAVGPRSPRDRIAVAVETDLEIEAAQRTTKDSAAIRHPQGQHDSEEQQEHHHVHHPQHVGRPALVDIGVDPKPCEVAVETEHGVRKSRQGEERQNDQRRGSKRDHPKQQQQQQPRDHPKQQHQQQQAKHSSSAQRPYPLKRNDENFERLVGSIAADMAAAEEEAAADFSRSEALLSAVAAANAMITEVDAILDEDGDDGAQTSGPLPKSAANKSISAFPPQWESRPLKKVPGSVPSHVVERILASRADTLEFQRFNEQLYNTSNVSQYVFADRATNAILGDLVEEVLDEVAQLCDEFVDGLATHELQ